MAATLDGACMSPAATTATAPAPGPPGGAALALAPLPQGRSAGGLVALDGRLYLVGGVVDGGLAGAIIPTRRRPLELRPGCRLPREHLGAAASGGTVYVVGGRTGGIGNNLAAAEAFDPGTGRWSAVAELPTARAAWPPPPPPGGRWWPSAARPRPPSRRRRRSIPPAAAGAPAAAAAHPRHGLGVVAVGDVVYVLAGGPSPASTPRP